MTRSWAGYYDLSNTAETELPFYALNNGAQQYGFSSYNLIEQLKTSMVFTEERVDSLESSIKNDSLTQAEYNEKTEKLYGLLEWLD